MQLAYVSLPGRGATDALLAAAVARVCARGITPAGTVQTNPPCAGRDKCDMDVHVLPDGPVLRISQDLGAHARGCRLDSAALETAVAEAERRLDGAAIVVINKFGKQEAEGRGFVPLIAAALDRGLPVLVGVNALNLPAFEAFAGGLALPLPAEAGAIADWAESRVPAHAG
jgi:hypothetical protein